MYFPIGWPKYIKQPQNDSQELCFIVSNRDQMLFAVLSEDSLNIWYCKPAVQIVSYCQSQKSQDTYGRFCAAEWRPDSTAVAVMTSKNYVLIFKVDLDISVPNHHCLYVTTEGRSQGNRRESNGLPEGDSVPAMKLTLQSHIQLSASITCCLCIREELLLATTDGAFSRLRWNGTLNKKACFHLTDVNVAIDFLQSRCTRLTSADGHVVDMEFSPIIGGYCLVLSSGKALLMMPPSSRGENQGYTGVWATDLKEATCLAVNHRYRLIAYGCRGANGVVYSINEVEGTLDAAHRLQITNKNFPELVTTIGPVVSMKWTRDGTTLAMAWRNGGISLWSVFGYPLVSTVGGDFSFNPDMVQLYPKAIRSMEWGLEGYHLWIISCQPQVEAEEGSQNDSMEEGNQYEKVDGSQLMQLQFAKSALTVNPCMANHEHVFLQGEDKLYMNTGDVTSKSSHYSGCESHILVGSKQWQVIPISHSYLANNWPIRYTCVDKAGQCVAVAGKTGLAHYALFNRKWKLFGNETQERDLVVSGGMVWWKDFICVACYNIIGQRDEIRCYPRNCKLDNTFANIQKVPSQVLLLNTFRDMLIVFCIDSHVMLFSLERKNTQPNPSIDVIKIQEVALNNFIPHPDCVTGVVLTSLKIDSGRGDYYKDSGSAASQKSPQSTKDAESLLLNVAGKLLVFQRDRTGPQIKDKNSKARPLPFVSPSVVATNVENLWTTSRTVAGKLQLTEALWLGCGSHGMKVWLPLYPRNESQAHNFMSKRIMLPFRVDIYPLAVLFEEAVILGAASDAVTFKYSSPSLLSTGTNLHDLPYCVLDRTSQIYLHHILRQLLRRNLGVNALDLAHCCTELSYFPHVLELLLHEVLEAEATSKEPIPDPLLPRVVAFIQEFPEYLQTFVHCARKTEVALWPHLFSVVGNPKDLFEECLINGKLETAASYLIILQNLEKPMASRQMIPVARSIAKLSPLEWTEHATLLLDSAVEACEWDLARDIVRFLKAIDPNDVDASPPLALSHLGPGYSKSPQVSPTDTDAFNFSRVSNMGRIRSSSVTAEAGVRDAVMKEKPKLTHTKSESQVVSRKTSPRPVGQDATADQVYIDMILCRHARKLLASNRLRDLGFFAANIRDFQLVAWLKKERLRSGRVEDFVTAVRDLHHQFEWPQPVLSFTAFQQLKRKAFSTSSLQSLTLLDRDPQSPAYTHTDTLVPESPDTIHGHVLPQVDSFVSNGGMSDDIMLKPQASKNNSNFFLSTDDSSLATVEVSDSSSQFGDFEFLADSSSSIDSLSPELELLTQEVITKGPQQSEHEMRYLFQLVLEAGCLEWALLLALVLRDSLAVIRTINTASMTDTPLEIVGRMREGLSFLELWSDTECVGYKPFLHAIRGQIQVLAKLAEQTPPTLKLETDLDVSESGSIEEGNLSPGTMSIRSDSEPPAPTPPPNVDQQKQSECVVS